MECGNCTLCCKLLELHEVPSPIGILCEHCEPHVGCKIHSGKPKECEIYQCMYAQMDKVGIELRPDKSHVIFDKMSDDVICGRIEKGHKIKDFGSKQLLSFINQGFSILLFRGRESKCFLNEKHTEEYVREVVNDRSELHRRFN